MDHAGFVDAMQILGDFDTKLGDLAWCQLLAGQPHFEIGTLDEIASDAWSTDITTLQRVVMNCATLEETDFRFSFDMAMMESFRLSF